jgi:hypothetical protein
MRARQHLTLAIARFKRFLEYMSYASFDATVLLFHATKAADGAALVNLQLVGDFFLWLPYARAHYTHRKALGARTIIICGTNVESLAQSQFSPSDVFAIDTALFVRNLRYRAKVLRSLRALMVAETFCYGQPRDRIIHDAATAALGGVSFGYDSTYRDRVGLDTRASTRLYQRLIPSQPHLHRTDYHARLLGIAGAPQPGRARDTLADDTAWCQPLIPLQPYFVIAPGASRLDKAWPIRNFLETARRALELDDHLICVIVGAPSERETFESLRKEIGDRCLNLAGKNTLGQLYTTIASSVAVLCNDSAAAHIAAFAGTPAVALLSGATFGDCLPYPSRAESVFRPPLAVYKQLPCFGCGRICWQPRGANDVFPCLALVGVDDAWPLLRKCISASL